MLHGLHCIQSGCILPGCLESMHSSHCMDSTAYNRDPLRHNALNTLHSMMLHGLHCIQSGCFGPCCIKSTAFNHAAWNPLHSIMLHNIHCIQNVPFLHAAWNPLYSITMHFIKLHGIHSVIMLHGLRCIQSGSITPQCMESSAFNHAAWN